MSASGIEGCGVEKKQRDESIWSCFVLGEGMCANLHLNVLKRMSVIYWKSSFILMVNTNVLKFPLDILCLLCRAYCPVIVSHLSASSQHLNSRLQPHSYPAPWLQPPVHSSVPLCCCCCFWPPAARLQGLLLPTSCAVSACRPWQGFTSRTSKAWKWCPQDPTAPKLKS